MDLLHFAPQALLWLSGALIVGVGGFLAYLYWDRRRESDAE
jgi:hypothetical protein